MNKKTLLLFVTAAVVALACVPVFAHGSSREPQTGSDGGSVISATVAPRARIWYDERLWQTGEGQILVCEEQFKVESYSKKCYAKGDKTEDGRWSSLQTKHADGFVLKSYEYRFVGSSGYKILVAYYGPPEAPVPAGSITPAVLAPAQPGIVQIDKLVITANKVEVKRAKK